MPNVKFQYVLEEYIYKKHIQSLSIEVEKSVLMCFNNIRTSCAQVHVLP